MANATSLLSRIDKALNKVTPINRVLFKRVVSHTGDSLIGRTTSTSVDTLLSPQPAVDQAGRERFSGAKDPVETVISPNGSRLVRDDYILTMSANAISETELENPNLVLVFKDGVKEDVLYIMDYSPIEYQGVVITHQVYARSVKTT